MAAPFRVKLKSQTFTTYGLIVRKDINFSVKEFDVLYMLYSNPGMAFTKQQIYEAVWPEKANGYFHAVENTIFQIRKKIKKYSSDKNYIKTVVGYGYKFEV
ncbi:helix-turn-helix domain-containing protein [Blautia wexlerae]|uniref:winged helix-turn-helix domain-containing protein n=1 Tax=Blautia TaxID=572511 RepID=UPI001D074E03|nr:helix-turn-helix domain-containing protein [Blautia wexlerae]MCB6356752.1 helix-turn-helix domain-containing protein [Blautia wexlerae]MCB8628239.1 helix-turn-helix domain-containing protein [Blautia sp. DFI.6.71]